MRPLQARCHLGVGSQYRILGRWEEARAELAVGVEMLVELRMAFHLAEAETELAAATAASSTGQPGSTGSGHRALSRNYEHRVIAGVDDGSTLIYPGCNRDRRGRRSRQRREGGADETIAMVAFRIGARSAGRPGCRAVGRSSRTERYGRPGEPE